MFLVDIVIDRINSLFESLLREKEVNSSLLSLGHNSSLGVLILNIICYEGFGLGKRRSFEEGNSPEDLFCFQVEFDRVKA